MQGKTLCLSLLAAVTLMNPYGNEAAGQDIRKSAIKQVKREYRKTPDSLEGALTKKMIEDCIHLKADVDSSYTEIGRAKDQFDRLNQEITDLGAYLKETKKRLDSSGDKGIRAEYDRKVQEYNSMLPKLDKQLEVYRGTVSTYEQKSMKFDRECNGQPYYEDDYAEIVKKLGHGM